jgi:hypothetical protein|tara:strand:- start:295 stop:753 length:459 start_codon:yes stop_codon:yes gene_type:complete
MGSKFRNMKQVPRTLRPDTKYLEKWEKTVDMVHWESNSLIKRHPHIDPAKIIARNATQEFPADAITVRFRNQRLKDVGVYFYGKKKTRSYGQGSRATTWTSIDGKLRVTLPFTTRNGNFVGHSFQGELPSNMDMESLKIALDYIADTINEIK